ncbi:MAG: cytochrome c [Bacteroidota bacterium]
MKKLIITLIAIIFIVAVMALINSCATSKDVAEKSGSELWGENCGRCHNSPSPSDFSDTQWEIIGNHMKLRANFSDEEVNKMVKFLQSGN